MGSEASSIKLINLILVGSGRSSAKKVGGASVSVSLTPKKSGGIN